MSDLTHSSVTAGNVRLHCVACGSGPIVVLLHGFPESWYSWRYQLPALAEAGYRAVAIDVRGYGRSSKPTRIEDYRMTAMVGDVVALIGVLGGGPVTIIGHDWGAPIAWNTALLRPDLCRGVAGLSVPYNPPAGGGPLPTERMRAMAGEAHEFYIEYFQQPGRAEAEIEKDVRRWLLGFYWGASGEVVDGPNLALVPNGTEMRDHFVYPETLPGWLGEADLDVYAAQFEYSGFFGPLARYRNVDRDFVDFACFAGRPIEVPALFIGGSKDGPTQWGADAIAAFPRTLPHLVASEIIDGAGHWIQQEAAQRCNELILAFLATIHGDG